MELTHYLKILFRYLWLILLSMGIFALLAISTLWIFPPKYTATTKLRIELTRYGTASSAQLIYADRLMNTYVEIAKSSPVKAILQDRLGLTRDRPFAITVAIIPDSELISISVKDKDRQLARNAANTMATILVDMEQPTDGRISIIEPASLPELFGTRNIWMAGLLGLVIGGVVGASLAFLFENLDTRLTTVQQISSVSGLPILGQIPTIRLNHHDNHFVKDPIYYQSISRLRTFLFSNETEKSLKTLLITSPLPEEGKSAISANLAISLGSANRKVVIVDCDLHRPSVHKIFNIAPTVGLSDVLAGSADVSKVIYETKLNQLAILPAGQQIPNTAELLGSMKMKWLIEKLQNIYDHVILDTPAFLGLTDAAVLAPDVDGVLIVVRRNRTKTSDLITTCEQLRNINANLIGAVVNHMEPSFSRGYHRYYEKTFRGIDFDTIMTQSQQSEMQESE